MLNSLDGVLEVVTKKPPVTEKSIKESLLVSDYKVYKKPDVHILEESYEVSNVIFNADTQMVYFPDFTKMAYNDFGNTNFHEILRKYKNYKEVKKYDN